MPAVYANLRYYEDPFKSKVVKIRFGAHEYNIIYVKGVAENYNLVADSWSTPVKFSSDDLVLSGNANGQTFAQYYARYIVDWGSKMISEAKEFRLSAWDGKIPNAPTLNGNDFRVVQINTQINAAIDTTDVRNTASEIESVKSQINSLKQTIAAQKTDLQSADDLYQYNSIQQQIATNITDMNNLQTTYRTLVDSFQTIVRENSAVLVDPKYHIRGFFPVPEYKYRDEEQTTAEEIIGFDIAYRYIKEDSTSVQLNTFSYTGPDGAEYTGTFTDWIVEQGPMKQKIYDDDLGRYVWQAENIADGSQTNINQLDIAINKGEKVEIKVRSISEAGYPENPLRSPWSNSIIMEFPDTLATSNQIADLITMVNDDALTLTIQNNLESIGVTEHLNDTIPNSNSVNGMYYKHIANNIAYEETGINDNGTTVVNSISLQDKVEKIDAQSAEARKIAAENAQNVLNISTNMQKEHGRYNTSINQLEETTEFLSGQVEDISTDVHSFVSINRDDDGKAHPVLSAKEYVLVDDTNNEKAAMILDGTAVKLTNNLANPKDSANLARLFVEDVYLKSMNASTLN